LFATYPKPYTPYTLDSLTKRDVTIDRGGVEADHAFVLAYYSGTRLHLIRPKQETVRKSSRCYANLVPRNRGRRRKRGEEEKERGGREEQQESGVGRVETTHTATLQHMANSWYHMSTHCSHTAKHSANVHHTQEV